MMPIMRNMGAWVLLAALTGCPKPGPVPDAETTAQETRVVTLDGAFPLEGVLHLPATEDGRPVPGVVLVHGSGPISRAASVPGQLNMGFGFTLPVFKQLANALQERGVAVFRYDKRTCGTFNGLCDNAYPTPDIDTLTVHDFIADAVQASTWLSAQPEVDATRVMVVGHSQGGGLMPAILADAPELVGGISVAGPWRPIDDLLAYQLAFSKQLLAETGATDEQIEAALRDLSTIVDQLDALRAGTHDGAPIGGSPSTFWQSWIEAGDARPAHVLEETRPLLAIQGDYDWNVPVDPELLGWEASGVPTTSVPCVTHALNCISQPDYLKIGPDDIASQVSYELVDVLHEFITAPPG